MEKEIVLVDDAFRKKLKAKIEQLVVDETKRALDLGTDFEDSWEKENNVVLVVVDGKCSHSSFYLCKEQLKNSKNHYQRRQDIEGSTRLCYDSSHRNHEVEVVDTFFYKNKKEQK